MLSPSFAAPAVAPQVHEQAMRRLEELTGLVPVEYPTTRRLGASAQARAADLNAAFGDPEVRAVLATIGGEDQITVVPHLDPALVRADPKPFLGYSDNTRLIKLGLNADRSLQVPRSYGRLAAAVVGQRRWVVPLLAEVLGLARLRDLQKSAGQQRGAQDSQCR